MRVFVVLPNGSKIIIPLDASSTVSQLQSEALRRAKVLRLPYAEDNTVLHLGARDGPIAFEEDLVEDVLDLADDNTFWLVSLEHTLQTTTIVSHDKWALIRTDGNSDYFVVCGGKPTPSKELPSLCAMDYRCSSYWIASVIGYCFRFYSFPVENNDIGVESGRLQSII